MTLERAAERIDAEPNRWAAHTNDPILARFVHQQTIIMDETIVGKANGEPVNLADALRALGFTETAALVERLVAAETLPA